MKLYGTNQRLCFSAWLLGAVLLLSINGYRLLSLEGQPLKAYSPTIKSLESKLLQMNHLLEGKGTRVSTLSSAAAYFARFSANSSVGGQIAPSENPSHQPKSPTQPVAVQLPTLTGIVQIRDASGRIRHKALINGRIVLEHDDIGPFSVQQITTSGVVLLGKGKRWFIENPNPGFSSNQGG